jgi:hypothetical protein
MVFFSNRTQQNIERNYAPAPSSTGGNLSDLAFESNIVNSNNDAAWTAYQKVYDKQKDAFKQATGEDFIIEADKPDPISGMISIGPAAATADILDTAYDATRTKRQAFDAAVEKYKQQDPLKYSFLKNSKELEGESIVYKNKASEQAGFANTQAGNPFWTNLGAGLKASATDPLQILTMPLGGGLSAAKTVAGAVIKTAAKNAAVNAAIELPIQLSIADWQRKTGQEYGISDITANVGYAALFGGAFGGLVHGAKPATHFMLDRASDILARRTEKNTFRGTPMSADTLSDSSILKVAAKQDHIFSATPHAGKSVPDLIEVDHINSYKAALNRKVGETNLSFGDDVSLYKVKNQLKASTNLGDFTARQQQLLDDMERLVPDADVVTPVYTKTTMPQQVLQKLDGDNKVKFDDLSVEEVSMLESAGFKKTKDGYVNKVGVKQEIARRKQVGEWKESVDSKSHIEQFKQDSVVTPKPRKQIDLKDERSVIAKGVMDDVFATFKIGNPERPVVDAVEDFNLAAMEREVPIVEADIEDVFGANMDEIVDVVDGRSITLRELKDQFDDETRLVEAMEACAYKG